MKTLSFPVTVKENGQVDLPEALAEKLKPGQQIRLIVVMDDGEKAWQDFTMQQLLNQYSDADAIYDTME